MIIFDSTESMPKSLRKRFRIFQGFLLTAFVALSVFSGFRFLFPSQPFLFDFDLPDSSKNTFEDPRDHDGLSLRKGHVTADDPLVTYAGTVGGFASARAEILLENDSETPDTITVGLRKSYRSFFLPEGDPIVSLPKERALAVHGTPYLFSEETLRPFISDAAALSWYPKEAILPANAEILSIFPPAEDEYAGFRPGSLLSDAQGVYVIDGEGKRHPVANTDVFETLGFHWDDVVPVSGEELGLHERGRIMFQDAAQPDGTVFRDDATGSFFVIGGGRKLRIDSEEYRNGLLAVTTPIDAGRAALDVSVSCEATRSFAFLRKRYVCDIPLATLSSLPGSSFETSVSSGSDLHLAKLSVTFRTEPDRENFSYFLRKVRERFAAVYGNR